MGRCKGDFGFCWRMLSLSMETSLEKIRKSALNLSEKERLQLASDLILSVPSESDCSIDESQEAWDEEIADRIADIDSGKVKGIPASQVFEDLNKKFGWIR